MSAHRVAVFVLVLLYLSPLQNAFSAENQKSHLADKSEAYRLGYETARKEKSIGGAFGAGFAVGLFLPVIGPMLTGPLAHMKSAPVPERYLEPLQPDEMEDFKQGYSIYYREKRMQKYMLGGICGSVASAFLIGNILKDFQGIGGV
ncbi:MAG: hypothetical protein ACYC9O_06560 [Candidatus Latescibacterota bacterium]